MLFSKYFVSFCSSISLLLPSFMLKILCTVNEVSTTLKNVLQNHKNYDTMIIVIGPEGGFTDKEEAENHCNVGNGKIVLDFIDSWIEGINNEI